LCQYLILPHDSPSIFNTQDPDGLKRTTTYGYSAEDEVVTTTLMQGDTPVSLSDTISGVSGESSYAYNGDGALTRRTDAAGTTSYTYDGAGRVAGLANATAGLNLTYGYNSMSQVSAITYVGGTSGLSATTCCTS
jgi:YD repeat-containing protein